MSEKRLSRYAIKRKLRLVPLGYSDQCNDLCAAIKSGDESRIAKATDAFEAMCNRSPGGRLWN